MKKKKTDPKLIETEFTKQIEDLKYANQEIPKLSQYQEGWRKVVEQELEIQLL